MNDDFLSTIEVDLTGFLDAETQPDLIERSFSLGGEEIGSAEQSP